MTTPSSDRSSSEISLSSDASNPSTRLSTSDQNSDRNTRRQISYLSTSEQTWLKSRLELANKQHQDWKQILSGALNDKQLVCGIVLIFLFYVLSSTLDIAVTSYDKYKDNDVTCHCDLYQRRCFQTTVIGLGLIWIVCFVGITTYDLFRLICRKQSTDKYSLDDRLDLYENHWWLEFYKAYSLGSGAYETITPSADNKESITDNKESITPSDNENRLLLSFYKEFYEEACKDEHDGDDTFDSKNKHDRSCNCLKTLWKNIKNIIEIFLKEGEEAAKGSYYILYPFLIILRLLAQVTLVPMLSLQMLNTNIWVCITEDYHCQNAMTSYQLGLYQAYITFSFSMALLIAILCSIMLRWLPQSKAARRAGATSFI